ncbi:hypothetical protein [Deinococcus yavapaiensis]|uniref:ScoMcrA-like SRA domain-containing protein n=1 Tax=Deinococcus yavapaiensis KR-236 TaxID=694435 RepID=A0A318SJV2_9DEIO|nr:hypothetical protein [Deinococcus yavapaiensis]PYE52838.1 hypothetical protein DES52_1118 [Deinococcus yavapaiensis KR-236]
MTWPGPDDLERLGPYPWVHVRALHGGRRGIRRLPDGTLSLLLDYDLSGYSNYWRGDNLHYLGQGLTGDQVVTPATALLLEGLERGVPARVWERLKVGVWYDLGLFEVLGVERRDLDGRLVFDFTLRRAARRNSDTSEDVP